MDEEIIDFEGPWELLDGESSPSSQGSHPSWWSDPSSGVTSTLGDEMVHPAYLDMFMNLPTSPMSVNDPTLDLVQAEEQSDEGEMMLDDELGAENVPVANMGNFQQFLDIAGGFGVVQGEQVELGQKSSELKGILKALDKQNFQNMPLFFRLGRMIKASIKEYG